MITVALVIGLDVNGKFYGFFPNLLIPKKRTLKAIATLKLEQFKQWQR
jgi:hypothetical protein